MLQTRAEAAGLVLSLQRSALGRGLAWYAIAGVTGVALMFSVLLLIAFGTPPEYRALVLGLVSLALLGVTAFLVVNAKRQMTRDSALIADFTTGLRLDLAMVNLALKDPETEDEDKIEKREQAKEAVREAAADKAAAPSTAESGERPVPGGPSMASATAAMHAAAPRATEIETPAGAVTPPEAMTTAPVPPEPEPVPDPGEARRQHG
jgi:hypothetical protein